MRTAINWAIFLIAFIIFAGIQAATAVLLRTFLSKGFLTVSLATFVSIYGAFFLLMCVSMLLALAQEHVFGINPVNSHITTTIFLSLSLFLFQGWFLSSDLMQFVLSNYTIIMPTTIICIIVNVGIYFIRILAHSLGKPV